MIRDLLCIVAALLWECIYIVRKFIFDWRHRRGLCY